jgi:hypothetical protein
MQMPAKRQCRRLALYVMSALPRLSAKGHKQTLLRYGGSKDDDFGR